MKERLALGRAACTEKPRNGRAHANPVRLLGAGRLETRNTRADGDGGQRGSSSGSTSVGCEGSRGTECRAAAPRRDKAET